MAQKVAQHFPKNHQLACHFIKQCALIETHLREGSQTPRRINDFIFARRIEKARKFHEKVRQMVD
jgi:hypothetical protein